MAECGETLNENLNGLVLDQVFPLFDVGFKIAVVAIFHDQVKVIGSLLHVVQLNYVGVLTAFKHFYLALQQLFEFTYAFYFMLYLLHSLF